MNSKIIKRYSELIRIPTFEERLEYLRLSGEVGGQTFGFDRILNQSLYWSKEWKDIRNSIVVRDDGSDLACPDRPIGKGVIIHHLNPITEQDIINRNPLIFDPENLVCVSNITHNAIHYGRQNSDIPKSSERHANDTCPWR